MTCYKLIINLLVSEYCFTFRLHVKATWQMMVITPSVLLLTCNELDYLFSARTWLVTQSRADWIILTVFHRNRMGVGIAVTYICCLTIVWVTVLLATNHPPKLRLHWYNSFRTELNWQFLFAIMWQRLIWSFEHVLFSGWGWRNYVTSVWLIFKPAPWRVLSLLVTWCFFFY